MGGEKPQASGITIDNIGANRSYTYTPYYLSQGDTVTGGDFKQDAYLLMGREDGTSVSSYTLNSYFTPLSAAQQKRIPSRIRQMEREYEALINKRDTQLPDGVRDRLLAYAEKAGLTAAEGPEDCCVLPERPRRWFKILEPIRRSRVRRQRGRILCFISWRRARAATAFILQAQRRF